MRRVFLICALGALSCSSAENSAPAPRGEVDSGVASVEDAAEEAAAPEVCGINVGDTFCDHELMGYVRASETSGLASSTAYGAYKLTDALAKSTVRYVYVYASAYW